MAVPLEAALASERKSLGAYYTDSQVAEFLVWWAIRNSADSVLDPSFGGGVFLRAACKRICELGGKTAAQVFGVELDGVVHDRIAEHLHDEFGIPSTNLRRADFFDLVPERLRACDVVVGNPPFIRYQRFAGQVRKRALARAAEQGLRLSELSSSWLPFLIHSLRFLKTGGRIAMVLPFEIGHAAYARPALGHLRNAFDSITFLTFRKKLFADLSEDTLLILAEGRRKSASGRFFIRDLSHAGVLGQIQALDRDPAGAAQPMDSERIVSGEQRIIEYLLPRKARELYSQLRNSSDTVSLGSLADVGIGYVTGANEFFHPSPAVIAELGLPSRFLRACIRRGRALVGLRFTEADWLQALSAGNTGYLLELPRDSNFPESVRRYIANGERAGIHTAFKCRTRTPWYRVPHVYEPDAFLTYMSGSRPLLVANDSGAVAPNTLHVVRLRPEHRVTGAGLAALWQTSLTELSAEIEGHALGGGMLKLEPGEAERVLLPSVPGSDTLEALTSELDHIARRRGQGACAKHADDELLRRRLGLSAAEVKLLRASAELLRNRRTTRSLVNE